MDLVKLSSERAQERRACGASIKGIVNSVSLAQSSTWLDTTTSLEKVQYRIANIKHLEI